MLVGHSTGGTAAHALATRLADLGAAPAGPVLIDSYHVTPDRKAEPWPLSLPARTRMFRGWRPEPIEVPTLLVRASEPLADTAGTHLSVTEEDAADDGQGHP